jgi:hypothetical protein
MQCGSDPIRASRTRSYALRFLHEGIANVPILMVVNQDAIIDFKSDSWFIGGVPSVALGSVRGWNSVVVRVDHEQHAELFYNCTKTSTLWHAVFIARTRASIRGCAVGTVQ